MASNTQKTAAEKSAQNQADEVNAVVDTDPTEGGRTADAGLATAGVGDDAVLVRRGDTMDKSVYEAGTDDDPFVTVQKDVVEEFFFPGTKRPAYRVAFVKGQTVRKWAIDALSAKVPEGEPELRDYIDSSTFASGTGANKA